MGKKSTPWNTTTHDFKLHIREILTKQHYGTGTETGQCNRENSETNSCNHKHLIFTKALKIDTEEKTALLTNDAGTTGYLYAKEKVRSLFLQLCEN